MTIYESDMIPGAKEMGGKVSVASPNGAGGSGGGTLRPPPPAGVLGGSNKFFLAFTDP